MSSVVGLLRKEQVEDMFFATKLLHVAMRMRELSQELKVKEAKR